MRKNSGQGQWAMRMRSNKELGGMGCVDGDDDDDDDGEKIMEKTGSRTWIVVSLKQFCKIE